MLRRLLVPMVIALVAACSSGSGGPRDGGSGPVIWGDRTGVWGACYFVDRAQCVDFLDPPMAGIEAEMRTGCQKDGDGLWSEFSCPETQLGSCEVVEGQQILRYYRKTDVANGKYACDYMGARWTEP
ncbi:MAG TPA: hypothetical protein VGK67_38590 [Myxococcales bacterium]|jgi:hypothetical protein